MAGDAEWVTWPEAAAIVGCPVPTIDWYSRSGRIQKRAFRGPRPTLKRASVEQFADWWRDRQASRRSHKEHAAIRAASRRQPRPAGEWLSTGQAATALKVTQSHVLWLIGQGRLTGRRTPHQWWVSADAVRELGERRRAEEEGWVSAADAAAIVGCSANAILRAAKRGEIVQRDIERQKPSLARASVEEFKETWRARRAAADDRPSPRRPASAPPDDDHTWLTTRDVASLLNLGSSRVNQLASADLLPNVSRGARRWYRADLLRLVMNAKAAAQKLR